MMRIRIKHAEQTQWQLVVDTKKWRVVIFRSGWHPAMFATRVVERYEFGSK